MQMWVCVCVCVCLEEEALWNWLRWTRVLSAYDVDVDVDNGVLAEAEPDYMTFDGGGGGGGDDDVACVQMS